MTSMKISGLLMMTGLVVCLCGCSGTVLKDDSGELPTPGDGELHLNKKTVVFTANGGEDSVCDIYGVKLYLDEVKSRVGESAEITHPLGDGNPYVAYTAIDGGWFRLELEDDGAVLRCRVEGNDAREKRTVFVRVTSMPPAESGSFEIVQSGAE